ncbi:MAG: hypothetical protein Q9181_007161 [Wetmoreana brouardii]
MARPFTHLNLSSIYHWQELEKDKSFVYSLSPEEIQNGTIDPFILAATTVLHLLVSASRRLLNTDISPFEYIVLSICIIGATIEEGAFLLLLIHGKDHTSPFFKTFKGFLFPTSTLESLSRLAAKPGVQSTLVLSKSDGSIIRSTGLLASSRQSETPDSSLAANGFDHGSKRLSELSSRNGNDFGGSDSGADKTRSAEHVARMVFKFVAAANEFAEGMDQGDDTKLLRMRTQKLEIVVVPGQYIRAGYSQPGAVSALDGS